MAEENITRGGIDEKGQYRCFFCDGIVMHEGADDAEDVYPECYGEDDIVNYFVCSKCGAEYEVIQKSSPDGRTPMRDELQLRKKLLSDEED